MSGIVRISGLLALALGAACTEPPKEEPAPAKGLSAKEGAARARQALCERLVRCAQGPFATVGECVSGGGSGEGGTFDSPEALFLSVEKGTTRMDPVRAATCLTDLATLSCEQTLRGVTSLASCEAAFTGTTRAGGECISNASCLSGSSCVQDDATSCAGHCRTLAEGSCRRQIDCPSGLACDGDTCVPARAPGGAAAACDAQGDCLEGFACTGPTRGNTCERMPAEGETCTLGEGARCVAGLVCVPDATFERATCRRPKALGEACSLLFECGGLVSRLACTAGTCAARPASGPCLHFGSLGLCDRTRAFCDDARDPSECVPFRAEGEACATAEECGSAVRSVTCAPDAYGTRTCRADGGGELCSR